MTRFVKQSRSPYHKYGKRPFAYSGQYHAWREAVQTKGLYSPEAMEDDATFRRAFGVPPRQFTNGGDYV